MMHHCCCSHLRNLQYLGAGENNLTMIPEEIGGYEHACVRACVPLWKWTLSNKIKFWSSCQSELRPTFHLHNRVFLEITIVRAAISTGGHLKLLEELLFRTLNNVLRISRLVQHITHLCEWTSKYVIYRDRGAKSLPLELLLFQFKKICLQVKIYWQITISR